MKPFPFFMVVLCLFITHSGAWANSIKKDIEKTALLYFIDEAHQDTGLVRDRANNFIQTPAHNRVSSIAATGFGLTAIAHAASTGNYDQKLAVKYVKKTLSFAKNHVPRMKGWFLHFVDWESGERVWKSEYSTIDTALFVAGALYAARVLKDQEIENLANELHRDMDFDFFLTDDGKKPQKKTLTLSWTPENGFVPYQWEAYSEQIILLILGLGHPTKPLPKETWHAWSRSLMGINMPLFIHQYSLLYLDFRKFNDGYKNYFQAGLRATLLHRNIMGRNGFWGLSAGESPNGYVVNSPLQSDGSICIGCAAGSLMFAPSEVYADVSKWKNGDSGKEIWGKYGLVDSINPDRNWFSPYVLGITKGPEYLSSVNTDNQSCIWNEFMRIPAINRALNLIRVE